MTRLEKGVDYARKIRQAEEDKAVVCCLMLCRNCLLTMILKQVNLMEKATEEPTFKREAAMEGDSPSVPRVRDLDEISTQVPPSIAQIPLSIFDTPSQVVMMDDGHTSAGGFNAFDFDDVSDLPIEGKKKEILKCIKMNKVTVIEGRTGCGKTTRVPFFIMEDMIRSNKDYRIIVTQPRRIAAISVARRVSSMLNRPNMDGPVGYQIGMDRKFVTPETKLLYVTTGVLLQMLIQHQDVEKFSHIVLDEVHERSVDTDLLMMVLRKLIWARPTDVKVILMSATFETKKIEDYFKIDISGNPELFSRMIQPATVSIKQTPKSITFFYLDSLKKVSEGFKMPDPADFKKDEPQVMPKLFDLVVEIIKKLHNMEAEGHKGAVLIFLPGTQ